MLPSPLRVYYSPVGGGGSGVGGLKTHLAKRREPSRRSPSRARDGRALSCYTRAYLHAVAARVYRPAGAAREIPLRKSLDAAPAAGPDLAPWSGLLSGCSWRRPHTTKTQIYIHARASAARFSARCRWQGSSPGRFRTGLVGAQRGLRTNLFASSWESVPRCGPHIGAGPGCPVAGLVAAMRPKSAGR